MIVYLTLEPAWCDEASAFLKGSEASPAGALPVALVGNGPDHRADGQQRADHRFDIGGLDIAFGDEGGASDGQDLADKCQNCGFQHDGLLFRFHWWW